MGCKSGTTVPYAYILQLFMQPYSKAKNNKEKDNAKNTKNRTNRKIGQVSKAAREQNKAQHVSTGRDSISCIYLEKNTYTPYLYYIRILHAISLLHSSCILHNTCYSKCPAYFIFFITNTYWYDAYSMYIRPLALLQSRISQVYQYVVGGGVLGG